jgi:tRNA 2-selenouridine synthase
MYLRSANLSQLAEFDDIIDVRTPDEFAEDHLPGAINCPVLSNEERITVGTLYKQVSPFAARKVGAALVAKNIAQHLETRFDAHEKAWKPLIYCWRGGQRSGAMTIILNQVGWAAHKLEGGYKSYRTDVLAKLAMLPAQFKFRVICGPTGSGKSRLLLALNAAGQQVLDLETLAQHRGSVLGSLPDCPQPSPKQFDSQLLLALQKFDPARPVYVEAESNKIGKITLPTALVQALHQGECVLLETDLSQRVAHILQEYAHFLRQPELLSHTLQALHSFHGSKKLDHWNSLIIKGNFNELVRELIQQHYDPSYTRATEKHYLHLQHARKIQLQELSEATLAQVAQNLENY